MQALTATRSTHGLRGGAGETAAAAAQATNVFSLPARQPVVRRPELAALAQDSGETRVNALRALAYLAGGELSLLALLALSLVLLPQGIAHQVGLSYYGAQATTAAPYALAFLSAAFAIQRALRLLPARPQPLPSLRAALRAIVVLLLAVLATPYTGERILDGLHLAFAAALFASATALALWLAARVLDDRPTRALAAAQLAAAAVVLASESSSLHLLAVGELLFILAFGLLLIRSLAQILASAVYGGTVLHLAADPPLDTAPQRRAQQEVIRR